MDKVNAYTNGYVNQLNRWMDGHRSAVGMEAPKAEAFHLESCLRTNETMVQTNRRYPESEPRFSVLLSLTTLLHRAGKLRLHLPQHVLAFIADRLTAVRYDSREKLSAQAIGNALYGLQRCDDSEDVRKIIAALTPKIAQCTEELNAQAVTNALYGLQRLNESNEARELVAVLIPKIEQCSTELGPQHIRSALYGMQGLGDSKEVRALAATLTLRVEQCREKLDAQALGDALYGLRCLRDSDEARKLVAVLTSKIDECTETFDVKAVCKVLLGLQGLGDSEEVRKLISTLNRKIDQCPEKVSEEHIGDKLDGLKCLTSLMRKLVSTLTISDHRTEKLDVEVLRVLRALQRLGDQEYMQKLIAALAPKIDRCGGNLEDAQAVTTALRGLRQLGDSEEVRNLVAVLTEELALRTDKFIAQQVGKALYSLQRLGDSEQVQKLLAAWAPEIEQCNEEPCVQQRDITLYGLEQAVGRALYGQFDRKGPRISLENQMRLRGSLPRDPCHGAGSSLPRGPCLKHFDAGSDGSTRSTGSSSRAVGDVFASESETYISAA